MLLWDPCWGGVPDSCICLCIVLTLDGEDNSGNSTSFLLRGWRWGDVATLPFLIAAVHIYPNSPLSLLELTLALAPRGHRPGSPWGRQTHGKISSFKLISSSPTSPSNHSSSHTLLSAYCVPSPELSTFPCTESCSVGEKGPRAGIQALLLARFFHSQIT